MKENKTLSQLMTEHDEDNTLSAPAPQSDEKVRSLANLVDDHSFTAVIDGCPFKLRKIDYAESIEKSGIPADIVQTLMQYLYLANSGNEEEQERAEKELHENERLRNSLLVWQDSGLKLGMVDPRICLDGEEPEMESHGDDPARVTISMIHEIKMKIFSQIIG